MKAKRVLAALLCAAMIFSSEGFSMGVIAAPSVNENETEVLKETPEVSETPEITADEENEEETKATETPSGEGNPVVTENPEQTITPDETQTPEAEETPAETTVPTTMPSVTEEPTQTPAEDAVPTETPVETAAPSETPVADQVPEASQTPSATPVEGEMPEVSPTPSATPGETMNPKEIELARATDCFDVDENGVLQLKDGASLSSIVEIPKEAKVIPADTKLFKGNTTVTKIIFEEGSRLTEIAAGAFEGGRLESIQIPEGVTEISEYTFKNSMLKEITFAGTSRLERVGKEAFTNAKVTAFSAPGSLKEIGESAFSGCTSLAALDLTDVEKIGARAFQSCQKLNDGGIGWSTKLSEIGSYAFAGCGFTSLDMSYVNKNGTEETLIGASAFSNCTSLETVLSLPTNIKVISDNLFQGCTDLSTIVIPVTVEAIEESAFSGCKSLAEIEIPENIKRIEKYAFNGCESLKTVKILRKDTEADDFTIDENAFPIKSGVTMYGYGGKVEDYAEQRGFTFKSLQMKYSLSVSKDFSEYAGMKALNVTREDDKLWALPGTEVEIIVEPKEGYVLEMSSLSPKDISIELVSYTEESQTFRFEMPEKDVSIDADFFETEKLEKISKLTWMLEKVNNVPVASDTVENIIKIPKAGQQTKLIVTASGSGMNATSNPWLFEFKSSNKDVATISSTGIITAKGKGTAKITATLLNDATKKKTITLTVGEDVLIKNLSLDFTKLGRAKKQTEIIDGVEYTIIKYNKATLASANQSFKVALTATTENEPNKNLMVTSTWKSVNSEVATVSSSSSISNSNTVNVKKGTEGETMITVSVKNNDTEKTVCEKNFIVRVIDATPRLAEAKVTVNKASTIGTAVNIIPVYGYEIATNMTICKKVTKHSITTYEPYDGLQISYVDGQYRIKATSGIKLENGESKVFSDGSQLFIEGEFLGGGTFRIPVKKLEVTAKSLSPKVKLTGKINLFYNAWASDTEKGSVTLTQSLKDEKVRDYKLVSEANHKKENSEEIDSFAANFDIVQINNETFEITRTHNEMVTTSTGKNVTSGYIYLYYEGYTDSQAVKKKISISTYNKAPSYVLKTTSATASIHKSDQVYELQLVDKKTKKKVLDLTNLADENGLTFDNSAKGTTPGLFKEQLTTNEDNDAIVLQVDGTPYRGKAVINVKLSTWSKPLKYTFTLKTVSALPKAKLSAKSVTLNQNCRTQEATLQVIVNQIDAAIAGFENLSYVGNKKHTGDALKLIEGITWDNNGKIHVTLPDEKIKDTTYSFKITPKVQFEEGDRPANIAPISFKVVVNSKLPTIKLKSNTFKLNANYPGAETLQTTYTLSNIPAGSTCSVDALSQPTLTAVNTKSAEAKDLISKINVFFDEDGKVSVSLTEGAKFFKSFSYEYYVNNLTVKIGNDPVTLNKFKIKIKGYQKTPVVSLSAKGTINPLDRDSSIVYTTKVSNIASNIEDVDIWELDTTDDSNHYYKDEYGNNTSKHFFAYQVGNKTYVRVKNEEDVTLQAGTSYKVQLVYKLAAIDDKTYNTKELTIKPKQTLPKIKTDKTSAYIYAGQSSKTVRIGITKTNLTDVEIDSVVFANGTSDLIKRAYRVYYDADSQKAVLILINPALVPNGSKQTINLEVKYKYQMEKSIGSTFKVDITVRK